MYWVHTNLAAYNDLFVRFLRAGVSACGSVAGFTFVFTSRTFVFSFTSYRVATAVELLFVIAGRIER